MRIDKNNNLQLSQWYLENEGSEGSEFGLVEDLGEDWKQRLFELVDVGRINFACDRNDSGNALEQKVTKLGVVRSSVDGEQFLREG